MKKQLLSLLAGTLGSVMVVAQTSLPTSWSFATATLPLGWTESGTAFYSGSGNTPPAMKFDGTGDYMQIYFADAPGDLTYYLAGNSFSGGEFTVLESADGASWDVLQSHTSPPAGTYSLFTNSPKSTSRYIKFLYTLKSAGNIGLDDVNIALAPAGAEQEIAVSQNSVNVVTGSDFVVGNAASTVFTIDNSGTADTLKITGYTITGTDASDFSISAMPSTVLASNSSTFTLNFTGTGADGTKTATLSIDNNDSDENPFVINFTAIKGSYATAPTAQPTNLSFSNVKTYTLTGSFTAASSAPEGYIVLRKTGSAVTESPTDGATYKRGDYIGGAQVAYIGTATSFVPSLIVASTDYHFAVFSYNGPEGYENYLQTSPLTGSATSLGSQIGTYYNSLSQSASTFLTDLKNVIKAGHTQVYYSNYGTTIIPDFIARDTANGQKVVTCVYSGYQHVYDEPFAWTVLSREHTYSFSWMPTTDQDSKEYSDLHNLFPTHQDNANAVRFNFPLGEVVNVADQYMGAKLGTDANGKTVYEPRDQHKGDAARALFYMCTRWNGENGLAWILPPNAQQTAKYQDQNLLKKWHYNDLPDNWEIARNEYIYYKQKTRNPFVDSVDYVCHIDFNNMAYIANPPALCYDTTTSIKDYSKDEVGIAVLPNPNNGNFSVSFVSTYSQNVKVAITDMLGKVVYSETRVLNQGINNMIFNQSQLSKGFYTISVLGEKQLSSKRIIVQ